MKYNWSSLKNSFINGNYKNLKEFSEAKKIPYKTLVERARGWLEEKKEKDREKTEQIGQRLFERAINREIEREIDRNTEILSVHDNLITVLKEIPLERLQKIAIEAPRSFSSIATALLTLQKVHRIAEGLDLPQASGDKDDVPKIVFEIKDTSIKRDEKNSDPEGV